MERITKSQIKRFATISFIYSAVFAVFFTVLLIIALTLPDTASKSSVILLVSGDIICILLCALIVFHYCFSAVYEVERVGETVIFRTLFKAYQSDCECKAKIILSGYRCIVKLASDGDSSGKTLYLYKSLGFHSDLFNDEELRTIREWKETQTDR